MIKVLLVDDHDLVRMGIRRLLEDNKSIQIVGEANSGEEGIKQAKALKPDVVLMDAKMPGIGGLEATKKLVRAMPEVKVIALSAQIEEPYPSRFLQAGAMGYISKDTQVEEMIRAVLTVASGQRYLTAEIAQNLALKSFNPGSDTPFDQLSEREMQVTIMITSGQRVQDISEKLCLSSKTVNTYRYRIFEKLGIHTDVELTHLAIRHGVLDFDQVK